MRLIDVDSLSSAVDSYFAAKARTKKRDALKLEAIRLDMHGLINAEIGVEVFRMYGHWAPIDDYPHEEWECDKCGFVYHEDNDEPTFKYCPACGARMGYYVEFTDFVQFML